LTEENNPWKQKSRIAGAGEKTGSVVKQLEPLQGEVQQHKNQAEACETATAHWKCNCSATRKQQNLQRKIKEIVAEAKLIQNDNQL